MTAPNALVVCGDGINCEVETSYALQLVGFNVQSVHVSELLKQPERLKDTKLFCIPGGFSFGDEIASGKVLAIKMRQHMQEQLQSFIAQKGLVVGICNGFQVLVQLGLLPLPEVGAPKLVSLTHNKQKKFLNKWVSLDVASTPSSDVFFKSLKTLELPMRHGEGNLKLEISSELSSELSLEKQANVLQLVKEHASLRYSEDVNGSLDRIAALSSKDGTVMGLMPHPEAFIRFTQHPNWTDRNWYAAQSARGNGSGENSGKGTSDVESEGGASGKPAGLVIFENAFRYVNCAN